MKWTKQIIVIFLAIEFLAVSAAVTMQIPIQNIVGRIVMITWVALFLLFCIMVALFYDQKTDTFRWSNIYGKINSKEELSKVQ